MVFSQHIVVNYLQFRMYAEYNKRNLYTYKPNEGRKATSE